MSALNPNAPLRRHDPGRRPGWRPSVWTYALVIAWLAMLSVPLLMLGSAGAGDAALTSQPGASQPGMPIYVPIV